MTLLLYRWHLDASQNGLPAEWRRLVNAVVVPLFQDPAPLTHAACLYASKQNGPPPEVWVTLIADEAVGDAAAATVTNRLKGARLNKPVVPERGDDLCADECESYRRRLTQVTRIALDLHKALEAHADALKRIWGSDHNTELAAYLSANSQAYRAVCATPEAATSFWEEFWKPSPHPSLPSCPGHWMVNLIVAG
jgi:hypothetical protein